MGPCESNNAQRVDLQQVTSAPSCGLDPWPTKFEFGSNQLTTVCNRQANSASVTFCAYIGRGHIQDTCNMSLVLQLPGQHEGMLATVSSAEQPAASEERHNSLPHATVSDMVRPVESDV